MNHTPDNIPVNTAGEPRGGSPPSSRPPVYEKPVIRKYDQIDQVKPYGPSELEAG